MLLSYQIMNVLDTMKGLLRLLKIAASPEDVFPNRSLWLDLIVSCSVIILLPFNLII